MEGSAEELRKESTESIASAESTTLTVDDLGQTQQTSSTSEGRVTRQSTKKSQKGGKKGEKTSKLFPVEPTQLLISEYTAPTTPLQGHSAIVDPLRRHVRMDAPPEQRRQSDHESDESDDDAPLHRPKTGKKANLPEVPILLDRLQVLITEKKLKTRDLEEAKILLLWHEKTAAGTALTTFLQATQYKALQERIRTLIIAATHGWSVALGDIRQREPTTADLG